MSELKFTQSMTVHLNGGNKFSELHYQIMQDGKPCGISRHTRTLKTADELHAGDETFDILATKGVGMMEWIKAHAKVAP